MDITLRSWILIIASFFLVGIVLDGIRRTRKAQADQSDADNIEIDADDEAKKAAEDLALLRAELPNGGARRVSAPTPNPVPNAKPVAVKINLGEDVPVLMESVPVSNPIKVNHIAPEIVFNEAPDEVIEDIVQPLLPDTDDHIEQTQSSASEILEPSDSGEQEPALELGLIETTLSSKIEQLLMVDRYAEKLDDRAPVKDVISVNVVAKGMDGFAGQELIHILLACDMRFGDKDIFHRYESPNGSGKLQFSMANAIEPGTFDLTHPNKIKTRGLSFFMGLPGPKDTIGAFDAMAEIAYVISRNLGGEVRDDSHSVMTPQTLEHYRQRIKDFERKQLSLKIN
jgi:cell division protein ZipA